MARVVKERHVRRHEILDVTQRLVQTKGYEQMTIQDILDELRIAKGTFYHHFGSKQALLDALTVRMLDEVERVIEPIVRDPSLPALEKFDRFFDTLGRWKTARKPFFLQLLSVWYADDNAIVRDKMRHAAIERVTPPLSGIIRQGMREGTFKTTYPDEAARVVQAIGYDLSDTLARLLLASNPNEGYSADLGAAERVVAAYTDALERVLGVPTGSLCLVDAETLREWFPVPDDRGVRDGSV